MMSSQILSLLIMQTIQVTVLILIVWIATRFFAKQRPHLAHALWALVLLKCLTPPIISSPTSAFSWLNLEKPNAEVVEPIHVVTPRPVVQLDPQQTTDSPFAPIVVHTKPIEDIEGETGLLFGKASQSSWHTSSQPPTIESARSGTGIGTWLLRLWIAGAVFSLFVMTIRLVLFARWVQRQHQNSSDESSGKPSVFKTARETLNRVSKKLKVKRTVRVRVVDGPVGPAVYGLLRPTILIPASLVKEKSPEALEPLLAHELIHIRRGDLWWAVVQTLAKCLFWFHPLVRLAVRMVTLESERSCDEETVASLECDPAAYARGLLEVLEHKHRLRVAPALPGVRPVDITSARLERVMNFGKGIHNRTPMWVWLVLLISCSVALPGAALVFGQEKLPTLPEKAQQEEVPERQFETVEMEIPVLGKIPYIGRLFKNVGIREVDPNVEAEVETPSTYYFKDDIQYFRKGPEFKLSNEAAALKQAQKVARGSDPEYQAHQQTWSLRVHNVEDLEKLHEDWVNVRTFPYGHPVGLPSILGCKKPGTNGETSTPGVETIVVQLPTEGNENVKNLLSLGGNFPTMRLIEGTLFVFANEAGHAEVEEKIQVFREFGFRQIVIEARMIRMPIESFEALEIDWSLAASAGEGIVPAGGNSMKAHSQTSQLNNANPDITIQHIDSAWTAESSRFQASGISESVNHRNVAATSFVEKNSPVLHTFLDDDELQAMFMQTRADSRSNVTQAPTVTVFNGQSASIVDGSVQPFVVGLNRMTDGDNVAIQPVIRRITQGTTLQLNARMIDGNMLNLDCRVEQSQILGVETVSVPIRGVEGMQSSIQVPEVATTRIHCSQNVPVGKSLAFASYGKTKDGESEIAMSVLTCRIIDAVLPAANTQVSPQTEELLKTVQPIEPSTHDSNELPRLESSNNLDNVEVWTQNRDGSMEVQTVLMSVDESDSNPTRLIISAKASLDSPANDQGRYSALIEKLKEHDLDVKIEGDVQYEFTNDGLRISGQELRLRSTDEVDQIDFSGDEGVVSISNDGLWRIQLNGKTTCKYGELVGSSDTLDWHPGSDEFFEFTGSVALELIDAKSSNSRDIQIFAERVIVPVKANNEPNQIVIIHGAAHLRINGDHPVNMKADRIEWNQQTNEIKATNADSNPVKSEKSSR